MKKFDSGKYSVAFGFILHICCLLTYKKTAHYAYVTVIFDKNYLLYIVYTFNNVSWVAEFITDKALLLILYTTR